MTFIPSLLDNPFLEFIIHGDQSNLIDIDSKQLLAWSSSEWTRMDEVSRLCVEAGQATNYTQRFLRHRVEGISLSTWIPSHDGYFTSRINLHDPGLYMIKQKMIVIDGLDYEIGGDGHRLFKSDIRQVRGT